MTHCKACKRESQLWLCDDCEDQLRNMLDEIPWLLEELDTRIQKLDRIAVGTVGRSRRPEELDVMDFDAAETARTIRKTLLRWVKTIGERASGRPPAALHTAATADLARWLSTNIKHVARDTHAGKLYADIAKIVGTNQQGGQLVRAINPIEKHLVGPCPTTTGRTRNGTPRRCGQVLFADTYDETVTCPSCKQDIDVKKNRERAAADRDLHTKASLLEVLANIDEPVTKHQVDAWIGARRLRPRGYRHDATVIEFRINEADEPVYSVERARKLRRRDNNLRTRRRTHA